MRGEDGADLRPESLRAVARNGVALLLAYVLPRTLTFVSVVVAARVLGTGDFGAYGTAAAFAVILSILATLGMLPLLVREIARDPDAAPRLVRAAHLVKTVAGAAMVVALVLLAQMLGYAAPVAGAALVLGFGYWLGAYAENLSAYFHGVERMRVCTEAGVVFGLVAGGLGLALILLTGSIVWFAVGFLVGQAAALLWYLARAPAAVRWGTTAEPDEVVRLTRAALPFALAFVGLTVHYKLDVLLLERFRPPEEVGVYAAAYKFVDVFHALVLVAVGALFPRLSRSAGVRRSGRWVATRATEVVLLAGVPAGAGLFLLREPLVQGLFGQGYGASAAVLALLAPVLPAMALNLHGGYVLGAERRMGWVAALYSLAVVMKVALVLALVPRWGATGAAAGVLGAEVLLAAAFLGVLGRVAGAAPGARSAMLAASAGALAVGAWTLAGSLGAGWATAAYAVAVIGLYWAGGAVSVGERRALRGALSREGAGGLAVEGLL